MFDQRFLEDLAHWVEHDRKTALRLMRLIEAILRDPFSGVGKPEPLKRGGSDTWSRRLTDEHRDVYRVFDDRIGFAQARFRYAKE